MLRFCRYVDWTCTGTEIRHLTTRSWISWIWTGAGMSASFARNTRNGGLPSTCTTGKKEEKKTMKGDVYIYSWAKEEKVHEIEFLLSGRTAGPNEASPSSQQSLASPSPPSSSTRSEHSVLPSINASNLVLLTACLSLFYRLELWFTSTRMVQFFWPTVGQKWDKASTLKWFRCHQLTTKGPDADPRGPPMWNWTSCVGFSRLPVGFLTFPVQRFTFLKQVPTQSPTPVPPPPLPPLTWTAPRCKTHVRSSWSV